MCVVLCICVCVCEVKALVCARALTLVYIIWALIRYQSYRRKEHQQGEVERGQEDKMESTRSASVNLLVSLHVWVFVW